MCGYKERYGYIPKYKENRKGENRRRRKARKRAKISFAKRQEENNTNGLDSIRTARKERAAGAARVMAYNSSAPATAIAPARAAPLLALCSSFAPDVVSDGGGAVAVPAMDEAVGEDANEPDTVSRASIRW